MKPLAKPAIEAVKIGKIKFYPKRWTKVYLNWMENIQDWCISRQIWWGHRLPVYYCKKCIEEANIAHSSEPIAQSRNLRATSYELRAESGIIVSRTKPDNCPNCGSVDIYQDDDVLDTWFSSWLWPFATFYWPNLAQSSKLKAQSKNLRATSYELRADLGYFYPTSVLVTAPEIIFFWVARMIMAGLKFMEDIPFKDVYIHGTVRDIEGKKMSKSLGNIIDPLDIINDYGADALRFSLISITAQGQDVFLSKERFEQGRNFANKIWNASRFILMNLEPEKVKVDLCTFFKKENLDQPTAEDIVNRWILSRFYSVLKEVNKMLDTYRFNEAANTLYGFFWHEFCDWYLEMIKPILVNRVQSTEYRDTQAVMYKVLEKFLRALHPFMPFVTEEIWQRLMSLGAHELTSSSIMVQAWPHIQEQMIDKKTENKLSLIFDIITTIRNLRQEVEIPVQKDIELVISTNNKENKELIELISPYIKNLARLSTLKIDKEYKHIKSIITAVIKDIHVTLPLSGVVDVEKEKIKIEERIEKTKSEISAKKKTLSNKEFLKKAPPEVVDKEKERVKELNDILKRLKIIKDELSQP